MMNFRTLARIANRQEEDSATYGMGRSYGGPASFAEASVVKNAGTGPESRLRLFEETILPHLNAAYNLARWLTRNEHDAQDVVQESYLRAFRFFDGYRGGDGKAWLLEVVRNTCFTFQRRQKRNSASVAFDEAAHTPGE